MPYIGLKFRYQDSGRAEANHSCIVTNHIIKFADDTKVVGFISNNDETHYREEVAQLAEWCGANNLTLNVEKTKEVVIRGRPIIGLADYRRRY